MSKHKMNKCPWILVTGASSGIGKCVAEGLNDRGYKVIATVRKEADGEELAKAGVIVFKLDLGSTSSIENLLSEVKSLTSGQLFGLFNNAAFGQPGAVEDLSRQALREQFETNLFGTHELTRAIIPLMLAQGHGRIIQNSSILGFVAMPFRGAYNASKFALEGLTDTMRMELKGTGIEVVSIQPGPILSSFRQNSHAAYQRHIQMLQSRHDVRYKQMLERLTSEGAVVPFTLPADAVLKKVIKALESKHPRAHYHVTFPTSLFAVLKRILPYKLLQYLLMKI